MKARKVKGLDPDGPFAENLRRIVKVRVEELASLGSQALKPDAVEELHDTRIAAKRLRYVLELAAPAFGRPATNGARVARGLQDLLGEIHDCDVMLPRIREHADGVRAEDVEALRFHAGPRARDLEPEVGAHAPNLDRYRGLEAFGGYVAARRGLLFERFVREWKALERRDFAGGLLDSLSPPPPASEARADGGAP
jgi:hypothetical protein